MQKFFMWPKVVPKTWCAPKTWFWKQFNFPPPHTHIHTHTSTRPQFSVPSKHSQVLEMVWTTTLLNIWPQNMMYPHLAHSAVSLIFCIILVLFKQLTWIRIIFYTPSVKNVEYWKNEKCFPANFSRDFYNKNVLWKRTSIQIWNCASKNRNLVKK